MLGGDAEPFGIAAEVLHEEVRREAVESRRHRRVRREQIARAAGAQRHVEWQAHFLHEMTAALQKRKGRVPFVEMTHRAVEIEQFQQPPAAGAQSC